MASTNNYEKQLAKFRFTQDGLYSGDLLVAYCNPVMVKKAVFCDIDRKCSFFRYYVKAEFLDGSYGEIKEMSELDNLSCFALWQCPDVGTTGREQKQIRYKLQMEAANMEAERYVICRQGLQRYQDQPIYVMGDKVFTCGKISEKIKINAANAFPDISGWKESDVCCIAADIINILPGVSEIMFYYALQAVVKPILHEAGMDTNYLLAVIGPSGHLKTSLSKKIFLWLSDKEKQMSSFSSQIRMNRLQDCIDCYTGMCYMIDDFHTYSKTQDIDRQAKRLDDIVRHVEECSRCASIVVTGEYIDGIFSCIDRMLVVNIPKMDARGIAGLKQRMNAIAEKCMPALICIFSQKLLDNIEDVKEECKRFYNEKCAGPSGHTDATRTYRHYVFLRLTELLYRKYICGGSAELSCLNSLEDAIEAQYQMQQRQLQRVASFEKHDYISDVFSMLGGNNKYLEVITDINQYTNFERTYFQKGNTIYVTRFALRYGMMLYYEKPVDINKIIRLLENEGLLNTSTDSFTKKLKGRRHYLISVAYLKDYIKYRDMQQRQPFSCVNVEN